MNQALLEVTRNMAKALNRTQYYPPDRMRAYQRKLLEPLLHHARKEVPFYANRLDPLFANDGSIRWEAWNDIPTFTRAEAQQAGDALFAISVPKMAGSHKEHHTSGSTGIPMKFRISQIAILMSGAVGERIFEWHKIDLTGKMAFIVDTINRYPYPDGAKGQQWNAVRPEAPACELSLSASFEEQLEWLMAAKPDILTAYPTVGTAICELAAERGISVPFHTFIGQGEVFNEESKTYLAKNHGLKLIDRYGASEVGAIAAQCSSSNRYHQFCEANLMEVLDFDSDTFVKEGRGRLVLTPFYNYAMPLIRYENQDQIEVTQAPCPCGCTLPSVTKILGRERHVFTYEDGSRSWPNLRKSEYAPFLPARQIQVIQKTKTDIELRFVREANDHTPIDRNGLELFLHGRLHPSIHLEIVETDEIPRAASGKFENWVSLIT